MESGPCSDKIEITLMALELSDVRGEVQNHNQNRYTNLQGRVLTLESHEKEMKIELS